MKWTYRFFKPTENYVAEFFCENTYFKNPLFSQWTKSKDEFYPRLYRNPELIQRWDRVVLLVRNPEDVLIAEYNRKNSQGNHTGLAPLEEFSGKKWKKWVETTIERSYMLIIFLPRGGMKSKPWDLFH